MNIPPPNALVVFSLWTGTFALLFALEFEKLIRSQPNGGLIFVRCLNLLIFMILFGLMAYTTGIRDNATQWRLITRWSFLLAWFPFVANLIMLSRKQLWIPYFVKKK